MGKIYTCNGCGERVYWETILDLSTKTGTKKILLESHSHDKHFCKGSHSKPKIYSQDEVKEFERKRLAGEI